MMRSFDLPVPDAVKAEVGDDLETLPEASLTDARNPADRFLMAAHNHLANDADSDDHLDDGNGR